MPRASKKKASSKKATTGKRTKKPFPARSPSPAELVNFALEAISQSPSGRVDASLRQLARNGCYPRADRKD